MRGQMRIKTTMRYHLTSVRMAIINQQTHLGKDVEKMDPHALLVGMQIGTVTTENNMEVPQKNKKRNCLMDQ